MTKQQAERDAYVLLQKVIEKLRREAGDAEYQARIAREEIDRLMSVASHLRTAVCAGCNGVGTIQHWYAQDDVKAETCGQCKGSGVAP